MQFVSQRKFDLVSTLGHVIGFEKGVPIHVPTVLHKEAIAAGCVAVDGEVNFDEAKDAPVVMNTAERTEMINMALADIKDRNVSTEFNATGVPKVKVVATSTGIADVTAAEITALWDAMNQGA